VLLRHLGVGARRLALEAGHSQPNAASSAQLRHRDKGLLFITTSSALLRCSMGASSKPAESRPPSWRVPALGYQASVHHVLPPHAHRPVVAGQAPRIGPAAQAFKQGPLDRH